MYIQTKDFRKPSNHTLDQYISLGNEAIKNGEMDECVRWYNKGLAQARALNNNEKVKELSFLLYTLF